MHECCKLLQIIFYNAFLLITSVLMDMDVHTHTHPEQFWGLRDSLPCSSFQLFPWRINKNIKLLQAEHAEGKKRFNTEGGGVCCELLLM